MKWRVEKCISLLSLFGEMGSVDRSFSGVWDRAPAENKFDAFLASQNTSCQILVEQ